MLFPKNWQMEHITKDLENLRTAGVFSFLGFSAFWASSRWKNDEITFFLVGPGAVAVKRSCLRNVQSPKSGSWLVEASSLNIQYQNMNIKDESFWCPQTRNNIGKVKWIKSSIFRFSISEWAGRAKWSRLFVTKQTTAPEPAPSPCPRSEGFHFTCPRLMFVWIYWRNNCQFQAW